MCVLKECRTSQSRANQQYTVVSAKLPYGHDSHQLDNTVATYVAESQSRVRYSVHLTTAVVKCTEYMYRVYRRRPATMLYHSVWSYPKMESSQNFRCFKFVAEAQHQCVQGNNQHKYQMDLPKLSLQSYRPDVSHFTAT